MEGICRVTLTRGHGAGQVTKYCRVKPDGPSPDGGSLGQRHPQDWVESIRSQRVLEG